MGTLREDLCFMVISHEILLGMRNLLDKSWSENQNTFYLQYLFFK